MGDRWSRFWGPPNGAERHKHAKRMDVSPVLKAALPSAKESESEWSSLTSVETDDEGESTPMSDHEVSLLKIAQIVEAMTHIA